MKIIETSPEDRVWFRFRIPLDGVQHVVEVFWNDVVGSYYLSLHHAASEVCLVRGLRLAPGKSIWEKHRNAIPTIPKGDLALYPIKTGDDAPIKLGDIGTRCHFVYWEEGELAQYSKDFLIDAAAFQHLPLEEPS